MVGRLRGELLDVQGAIAVVDAGGVGYEVLLPESVAFQLPPVGEFVDLTIRTVVREDSITLYGFLTGHERRLFDLLTEVNGCGPKSALALIGQLGEETVTASILSQDAKTLTRAPGVGPKLADRIILELKEKIAQENLHRKLERAMLPKAAVRAGKEDTLVEALLALGYRRQEAEAAAHEAREQVDGVEEQLKVALRGLVK